MVSKLVVYDNKARGLIKSGVDKLANAVRVTLGPKGRNVLLRKSWGAPHVTRDGVTIAKEIFLEDLFEDMGAQMVKTAASKTCDEAGDGTTTATVLTQAIYNEGLQLLVAGYNPVDLKRGIDKAVKVVVDYLDKIAKPVQDAEEIMQVGIISANDKEIGELVAEGMKKVGKEGVISIEESQTFKTYLELSDGMQFDRGYITPYFVTDGEHSVVDLPDSFILICDDRIEEVETLVPLLQEVSKSGKPILIIAEDYSQKVLATLIQNKLRGALFNCPVKAPGFGQRRKEILKDLSVLTGATLFSNDIGMTFKQAEISHLGKARKVVVNRISTTIIGGNGEKEKVLERANQIRADLKYCDSEYDRKTMKDRLAKLVGGIAVIRVGAPTEPEMKEKKDRVEDAVHATRAAVEEGIVPGGGVALLRCSSVIEEFIETLEKGEREGAKIILNSLKSPLCRIVENAGGKPDVVEQKILNTESLNFGYNAVKDSYEDLIGTGIIDPKKVVRCAIQNAASVASMLITTEAMIADNPIKTPKE